MQTGTVDGFPVVLFGVDYWTGLLDWIRGTMLEAGYINAEDLDLITVTDDVEHAVAAACAQIDFGVEA